MLGAASVDVLAEIVTGQLSGGVFADPLTMRLLHLDAFGLPTRVEADPAVATPICARSTSRPITPVRISWAIRWLMGGADAWPYAPADAASRGGHPIAWAFDVDCGGDPGGGAG